jgi:hypothetical protein
MHFEKDAGPCVLRAWLVHGPADGKDASDPAQSQVMPDDPEFKKIINLVLKEFT